MSLLNECELAICCVNLCGNSKGLNLITQSERMKGIVFINCRRGEGVDITYPGIHRNKLI